VEVQAGKEGGPGIAYQLAEALADLWVLACAHDDHGLVAQLSTPDHEFVPGF
jgi:hypothetical protein